MSTGAAEVGGLMTCDREDVWTEELLPADEASVERLGDAGSY